MKTRSQKNKKVISGVIIAIVLSFITYSYAIASTTFSTSDSRSKDIEIQELQTEIAELEINYFKMMNSISVADAGRYGMKELKTIGYADIDSQVTVAFNQ